MVQPLFEQLTPQLNFLLLSQRQMILVAAFAVAIATFAKNIKQVYIAYISLILLSYSLAVGIKAAVDFNAYIEDVLNDDPELEKDEKSLVNRSKTWVYFSYAQIGIVSLLMIIFIRVRKLL